MGVALNLNSGRKSPNDETCDKIARAKVIMRDNLSENISAQEVARRLHVSYSWFRTAFKRHAGMAPAQYILELKLFRAMELLSDPAMTVKEVSYALDFNSSRYFSSFSASAPGTVRRSTAAGCAAAKPRTIRSADGSKIRTYISILEHDPRPVVLLCMNEGDRA